MPLKAIEGNIPAVVTPFEPAGGLVLGAFSELLDWHLANGADGLCIAGDNGEAWALSLEERRLLAREAVRVAGGKVPVIMGASATTARQSIAYAEIAAEAGVDALMIGPQSYVLKASRREIIERFAAIDRAVPLPILLYNSPRRTGLNLDVETFGAICDAVPVAGVKEASRDFFHLTHILHAFGSRVSVLIGPCHFIFPGLALGARGFIATGPELFGKSASRIRQLAAAPPSEESRKLHYRLTRLYETLMSLGTWPAALKAALGLLGLPSGVPREPVLPLPPDEREKLSAVMEELHLLHQSPVS